MLFNYDYVQVMTLILSYMVIYNLTSFVLFTTIMQTLNSHIKTLFSFSTLGASNIFTKIISLTLLSLAGVPPLLGFFSKIFVFVLITNSHLFVLFPPFFILLFVGLYFYIQNLRFLTGTSKPTVSPSLELSVRSNFLYFTLTIPFCFLIIFGFFFVDDLFIIVSWLLY